MFFNKKLSDIVNFDERCLRRRFINQYDFLLLLEQFNRDVFQGVGCVRNVNGKGRRSSESIEVAIKRDGRGLKLPAGIRQSDSRDQRNQNQNYQDLSHRSPCGRKVFNRSTRYQEDLRLCSRCRVFHSRPKASTTFPPAPPGAYPDPANSMPLTTLDPVWPNAPPRAGTPLMVVNSFAVAYSHRSFPSSEESARIVPSCPWLNTTPGIAVIAAAIPRALDARGAEVHLREPSRM